MDDHSRAQAYYRFGLLLIFTAFFLSGCKASRPQQPSTALQQCLATGWQQQEFLAAGLRRNLLWKAPQHNWRHGAIVILHGGGGHHYHFCTGGKLVQPQIDFARLALKQGFAVFLLDSTNDVVTDAKGRTCGKRFDFSVLERENFDLPYIGKVLTEIIPSRRPAGSSTDIYMTGLSTGGYMTIRASTHFDNLITAFAPVSAGDPYGTETICDSRLSRRKSAKGILVDRQTGKQITEKSACLAKHYPGEHRWESAGSRLDTGFKQFHNRADGIVDISCMRKAQRQLRAHGYRDDGAFILMDHNRSARNHLWLMRYNQPILDYFKSQ